MEIDKIGERLKFIREKTLLTSSQFARDNDIEVRTYYSYENNERKPNLHFLHILHLKYGVSLNWLISGMGNPYVPSGSSSNENCCLIPISGDFHDILGNGAKLYAETGTYPISKHLIASMCTPVDVFEIIFAKGNSMEPTILNGDSLLIDTSRKEIKDGRIYCIKFENEVNAKRLQLVPPKKIKVISDNKEIFDPFYIDLSVTEENFEILGEVRWIGRILK